LSLLDDIFKNSYVIVIDDFKYVKNKYITLVIDYIEQRLQMHKPIIFVSNFTLAQNHKDFTKFLYGEKNHIDIFFDRLELAIDGNFFPLLPKDNKL
jgi:DNA replication protein DnaC